MKVLERRGFREAAREEVAEVLSSEELLAYKSSGDPDCCPEIEVFVAAPQIRTVRERGYYWGGKRKAPAKNHPRGKVQLSLAEREEAVATPQDIRDRLNDQFSRCIQLGNEGRLTDPWKRFRRRHLQEIWEREEAR